MLLVLNCSIISHSIHTSIWNTGIVIEILLFHSAYHERFLGYSSALGVTNTPDRIINSPESWSAAARLDGDVFSPGGGCLSTARGTRPSGGESTDEPEVGMRTRHQSGDGVFSSSTSTCCPLWTLSSWLPAAATWSAITHVISTPGACNKEKQGLSLCETLRIAVANIVRVIK